MLKWKPELIMSGLKIMRMKMDNRVFLDSVSFQTCALRKLPESFGLSASKSWYPHYFNTVENLNYVGLVPDITYYRVNEMGKRRGKTFSAGTRGRDPRHSKINAYWNPTVRMTSQC